MINGLLFALFVLLQCVDFYTTYTIIKTGKGHEANPILAKIFDKIGYPAGLAIVKGMAIVVGFLLLQYWYALAILDILYVWVIFNNIKVMKGN
jgi:hypothetical protein